MHYLSGNFTNSHVYHKGWNIIFLIQGEKKVLKIEAEAGTELGYWNYNYIRSVQLEFFYIFFF